MPARMMDPATLLPGAREAIQGLIKATYKGGVPRSTMALVHLRASQINACAADVDSGNRNARKAGETEERLWSLAAWREAPYYTDAERAALALTEVMTRLADRERPDAVPDDVWDEITKHYTEEGRAALILRIATTNMSNRINTAIKATAGTTNWG